MVYRVVILPIDMVKALIPNWIVKQNLLWVDYKNWAGRSTKINTKTIEPVWLWRDDGHLFKPFYTWPDNLKFYNPCINLSHCNKVHTSQFLSCKKIQRDYRLEISASSMSVTTSDDSVKCSISYIPSLPIILITVAVPFGNLKLTFIW